MDTLASSLDAAGGDCGGGGGGGGGGAGGGGVGAALLQREDARSSRHTERAFAKRSSVVYSRTCSGNSLHGRQEQWTPKRAYPS